MAGNTRPPSTGSTKDAPFISVGHSEETFSFLVSAATQCKFTGSAGPTLPQDALPVLSGCQGRVWVWLELRHVPRALTTSDQFDGPLATEALEEKPLRLDQFPSATGSPSPPTTFLRTPPRVFLSPHSTLPISHPLYPHEVLCNVSPYVIVPCGQPNSFRGEGQEE